MPDPNLPQASFANRNKTDPEERLEFSLLSLVGPALRPLPLWPLQHAANMALRSMVHRQPEVFARLRQLGGACFIVDTIDLPFMMAIWPGIDSPRLILVERRNAPPPAIATIRGKLASFLALIEGKKDGDALFFSRELLIEGDMTAVLYLRNAIDGAEIDIARDLSAGSGFLPKMLNGIFHLHCRAMRQVASAVTDCQRAFAAPLERKLAHHEAALEALQIKIAKLGRDVQKAERRRLG
ncbi:MAG: SCP2 sterol-binding domain-containing protein [Proteobacteria bacterium]|nr:SCP2 sterol-binding domain-containing protein [Pseudomonadota bacterium]